MGLFLRWVYAFVLLALTYNPTQWNYVRWCMSNFSQDQALAVLLGLLLMIWYIIYLRATLRSIGGIGMVLVLSVVGALVWVLYDYHMLSFDNSDLNTWIAILALSIVLGIGLGWSIVRRMLTGQYDMDNVDH